MRPDDAKRSVDALIEQVRARRTFVDAVESVAVAVGLAAALGWVAEGMISAPAGRVAAGFVGVGIGSVLFLRRRRWHTTAAAALFIERFRPEIRNSVITAEELRRHPERASSWMHDLVDLQASRSVAGITADVIVTSKRAVIVGVAAVALAIVTLMLPNVHDAAEAGASLGRKAVAVVMGRTAWTLTVSVQPPVYSGLSARTLVDPDRVEVLEGTRLTLTTTAGTSMRVRFRTTAMGTLAHGKALEHVARDDGYFAIDDEGGTTRLLPLAVVRDTAPTVKIDKPARDVLLPRADGSIPLRISAADDLGLSSLELRYTRVSGSGEQFEFQEGTLPLAITRGSGRDWRADAEMPLARLNLAAGDSLVYRAVARDGRPGDAGVGASDTFFVEIAGPGQVPLEGIEMPPEEERYALSQQMIVLKIERLKARAPTLTREALSEESALLAAEQRSVRANFIFLLGGHVEDEEVEAEQSSEIAEGRLQNTARRDITQAIGHMTRAEHELVAASAPAALPPARAAVEALQRAFGRSRYLLRSLASRSRLDPSRRLSGSVTTAADWRRPVVPAPARDGDAARALLSSTIAAHDAFANGATSPADLSSLAERALSIDPSSQRFQDIARQLLRAHEQRRHPDEARKLLDTVIGELAAVTGSGLVDPAAIATPRSPLERAWRAGGTR